MIQALYAKLRGLRTKRIPVASARFPKKNAGFTIIEVAVAVTLLALFGMAGIDALLTLNRDAGSLRVMSAAREVVQRNMEMAMTVPFDSSNIPAILAVNTGTGWNETSDVSLGSAPIALITARDGTVLVTGTLKRTVALFSGSTYNANTRRITFTLDYSINGKSKPSYTLTSIRSPDI
ncbi:MAG: prepilin-type N-terminal cleavage/methylation domain-containing protein [Chthoniobacterales bacterium]